MKENLPALFFKMAEDIVKKDDVIKDIAKKYPKIAPTQLQKKEAMSLTNLGRMARAPMSARLVPIKGTGGHVLASRNPTMAIASQAPHDYGRLPQAFREAIENSAPVKQWGVPPHLASAIASSSVKPGQSVYDVVKQAGVAAMIGKNMSTRPGVLKSMGEHLVAHGDKYDLAGLGVLAAPSAVTMGQQIKNKLQGQAVDRHQVMHDAAELGGLGLIAAPVAAASLLGKKH